MIQGCYDCQNKWMYLLPFCFPATIFITLHSSSEQVLPALYFQPVQLSSLVMIMYWWLVYCLLTQVFCCCCWLFVWLGFFFNFCLILMQTASVQILQKLHYSVQKFALVCWRPKRDHCPDRCEFLQHVVSSHTGSVGAFSEAEQESKLRKNLFTGARNEDNWPAWRGLPAIDSTTGFWELKQVYDSHGRRIHCFSMLPS